MNYTIKPLQGFSGKIGELLFQLDHTRSLTKAEVAGLGEIELDYMEEAASNSIGALLYHMAAIEKVHQVIAFEKRDLTEKELADWSAALELGERGQKEIHGKPLDFYLHLLDDTRKETLRLFKEKEDLWLYEEGVWPNGVSFNQYYLWFHVMEDEISHRGQIRLIKRKLKVEKIADA
ncbi:DUF664 domain-containing protein [Planococcus sp. 107-1]|uniref:mycothiol transferase n=1 Tax=Planococcus sp. 107-1 TaxID=2908840 RepID=UPI001F46C7F5|nr:DUF664 domain-containing protein [Planococcus sp. 107-1]UJF26822.1 DinB family protein [Planococcus sp. 107-1]